MAVWRAGVETCVVHDGVGPVAGDRAVANDRADNSGGLLEHELPLTWMSPRISLGWCRRCLCQRRLRRSAGRIVVVLWRWWTPVHLMVRLPSTSRTGNRESQFGRTSRCPEPCHPSRWGAGRPSVAIVHVIIGRPAGSGFAGLTAECRRAYRLLIVLLEDLRHEGLGPESPATEECGPMPGCLGCANRSECRHEHDRHDDR